MRSEDYGDHSTRGGLVTEKWPTPRDVIWAFRVVGYLVRGARYVAKGRYDQALADYDRAIELSPDHASGFMGRGNTYYAMGRYDQALADYDRAIELDPTEEEFAAARTEICQLTGRSDY